MKQEEKYIHPLWPILTREFLGHLLDTFVICEEGGLFLLHLVNICTEVGDLCAQVSDLGAQKAHEVALVLDLVKGGTENVLLYIYTA